MSTKLKPCIFCGEKKRIDYTAEDAIDGVWGDVFCSNCHANGPEVGPAKTYEDFLKEATEAWNAPPRPLQWTTKSPTETGWYWNRVAGKEALPMRLYYDSNGEYCYQVAGLPDECWLVEDLADEVGCEWAGPIPEPQESQR